MAHIFVSNQLESFKRMDKDKFRITMLFRMYIALIILTENRMVMNTVITVISLYSKTKWLTLSCGVQHSSVPSRR